MQDYTSYIEANGFSIKGRHIYKRSQRTNKREVCGILNEASFYMFSENVYPFKIGLNYFDNKTLVDVSNLKRYVRKEIAKERNDFNITFEQYNDTSSNKSNLVEYYNSQCRKYLARPFINYYDVKSYDNFTAFAFIDFEGNFLTAQLIKYNQEAKRIKNGYSTTWLHSHKQAKKELGLKVEDKYSVKVTCFFGEHLLKDSTNTIAIVEAPKTAVILKMFYPNIDWIATAGESQLFNKDLRLLEGKNVVIYGDCKTTQWKEFAQKYGYYYSNVLDKNNCEAGSDLADYVFDSSHDSYTHIHSELYAISTGDFDFNYNTDLLQLNFKNSNAKIEYFTAVPKYYKGIQVHLKQDNSFGVKKELHDNYFEIYKDKYNVINAQIDWHKQKILKGGKLRGFNEKEFIKALHECYSVLKYLNKDADVKGIFSVTLDNLIAESNFHFNTKYVLNRLLPVWESQEQNLMQFVKQRNWKYKGNVRLTRSDFITELNNSRFRAKLKLVLKRFKKLITAGAYIPSEELFNSRTNIKRGLNQVNEMRKDWNKKVIGCTTKNQEEKLKELIVCIKNVTTTYNLNLYSGYKTGAKELNNLKKSNNWSNSVLADSLGVTRNDISKFLSFKSDLKARKRILNKVNNLLNDLTQVEPVRTTDKKGKKRITDFKVNKKQKEILITPTLTEAFKEPTGKVYYRDCS